MTRKQHTEQDVEQAQEGWFHVDHYYDKAGRKTHHFALYDGEELLAITVYKKGAEAIRQRLERYEEVIAEKTALIGELAHGLAELQSNQPADREEPAFSERVAPHRPLEQISFIAAEERSTYARTHPLKPDTGPKRGRSLTETRPGSLPA